MFIHLAMKHPLKTWLAQQAPKRTTLEFAAELGVHPISLRRLMNADDSVSRKLFEQVEAATGGELTAEDLFAFYQSQRRARREAEGARPQTTDA